MNKGTFDKNEANIHSRLNDPDPHAVSSAAVTTIIIIKCNKEGRWPSELALFDTSSAGTYACSNLVLASVSPK